MHSVISMGRRWAQRSRAGMARVWSWYRGRTRWQQIAIAVVLMALLIALITLLRSGSAGDQGAQLRTVTLESVSELSGNGSSVSIIGNVRSVTEADILAQAGGTVRRVHTQMGSTVGAGTVLAELENASERAAVLQAEGAYESALAARAITRAQAGNADVSLDEAATSARNTYRTAYTTLDSLLTNEVQSLYAGSALTPNLLLSAGSDDRLESEYAALRRELQTIRYGLDQIGAKDPETLLAEAERIANRLSLLLVDLSRAAAQTDSGATAAQRTNLSTARAGVDSLLASISNSRDAYRAKQTAAAVATRQSETKDGQVASADAQVKSALGSLRAAQAQLEKTIVRAPIAGTVNFLPIRVGDYVTAFTHVATVARNNALEIVAYVGEDDRALLAAGTKVTIESDIPGVVTSVAPALDPTTKQIEVRIAVDAGAESSLVNGQSVRIALPNVAAATPAAAGPTLLPLSAVKLRADERIVYTVNEEGRLAALPVEIGEVRGDRLEILTPLSPELRIVKDARGLSDGEKVNVKE